MSRDTEEKRTSTRMSGEDRRRQIADVAAKLFSQKGFNGTTTREIAEAAGVSEAIIFRHFESKEALYSAILEYLVGSNTRHVVKHLDRAAASRDDRTFFGLLAFDILEVYRKDRTIIRLLLYSALEGHKLSEKSFHSSLEGVRERIRGYVKQRIDEGAFRDVDPVVMSRAFIGMVLNHAQMRALYQTDDVRGSSRAIADSFVEIFLKGVALRDRRGGCAS